MVLVWQDKRPVLMLTTFHGSAVRPVQRHSRAGVLQVQKPTVIVDYTAKMGAVDHADHLCASYNFNRRSVKWWRKSFFRLLEVACINSFILYNINRQQQNLVAVSHITFHRKMIEQLVVNVRATELHRGRPSSTDKITWLNGKLHIIAHIDKDKDCAVCSGRKTPGCRRRTNFHCNSCPRQPGLHPDTCFEKYHTQVDFK